MDAILHLPTRHLLGNSELSVSPMAYGCWRFAGTDVKAAQEKIETAMGMGLSFIDTADIYGTDSPGGFGSAESLLGAVIKARPRLRHDMVLTSKGGIYPGVPYNSTKAYLVKACEMSLKRLHTDHLDLYQIHRADLLAPLAEVADALDTLRAQGKIREAGVSNFTTSQFRALEAHLDFPLATHQPEFSVMTLDPLFDGVLDQCQETGAKAMAWSPLAGGSLMQGRATNPADQARLDAVISVLDRIAARDSVDRGAVALAFVMVHPAGVIPIIGTQTPARIEAATNAFRVKLTRPDWYQLIEARRGIPMP